MRFLAPPRSQVDPIVFSRPPLAHWSEFGNLLTADDWPSIEALNELRADHIAGIPKFVTQTPALLADGMHYEQRIAGRDRIATRERNWHDLLNALVWLRFPALKAALNRRQVAEIGVAGPRARTRAQCALTHFDEAGVIVLLRGSRMLELWDRHDWHALFWRERLAWQDGCIDVVVFGHALLEHALRPGQLLVGKALAVALPQIMNVEIKSGRDAAVASVARAVASGMLLVDPQELRPFPLSGIPG